MISLDGLPERRVPLVADRAVGKAGVVARVTTAARILYDRYVTGEAAGAAG